MDLDLSYNALDGNFYPALAAFLVMPQCRLRRLAIVGNLLSYIRADFLATGIAANRTLVKLDMADNFLSYQGFLALEAGMRLNTSLKTVRFDRNSIRITLDDLNRILLQFTATNTTLVRLSLKDNIVMRPDMALRSWSVGPLCVEI